MTNFKLGTRSVRELKGVDRNLVSVVKLAIQYTEVDFAVHDGLRTLEEQRKYVMSGVSKTMKSKHMVGEAVDLVPYINRKLRWEWNPIIEIAKKVRIACLELNMDLRWGAVWDRTLLDLNPGDLHGEIESYVGRRKALGKRAFIDGPHFELI